MQNFEQIGRELERLGKADQLRKLADSPDSAKLAGMIDADAIGRAARSGDADALKKLLGSVLRTKEGMRLAENIRKMMDD